MTYEAHEYANLFPRLSEGEFAELCASVKEHGLLTSIVLYNGRILDGRHRYDACLQTGIAPRFEAFTGGDEEALAFVIALNATRRHLTASQRAALAVRLLPIYEAQAKERQLATLKQNQRPTTIIDVANMRIPDIGKNPVPQNFAERIEDVGEARKKAADAMGVNHAYVSEAKRLQERAPELLQRVEAGELSLQEAKREIKKQEREEKRARLSVEVEDTQVNVARVIYKTGDIVEIGNIIALCEDNRSEKARALIDNVGAAFIFCDPPYNAGVADWDGDFVWQQDYLIDLAPIVAVTPGIGNIDTFMRQTAMPYKWSTATFIENGMTRGALGFGNWIYTALFSRESIHRNAQDVWKITINARDGHELGAKRQKPPMYLSYLIDLLSKDGDTIVDAFAGSGIFGIVAQRLNRRAVLIEKNEDTFNAMVQRLIDKQGESE